MSILNDPIPPRPAAFTVDGAPPGVELRLDVFGPWRYMRPTIRRRLAVVHTNGASVEVSVQSSINYGVAGTNNTKPHYHVGDRPAKVLRSDLRGIANSTEDWFEDQEGQVDVSFWSLAIETADMGSKAAIAAGYRWPSDCGPFLQRPGDQPDDAEIVARILAYESLIPGQEFPLEVPPDWDGTGVVTHTWPFPHPHYTIAEGKTCPGTSKIEQFKSEILPRARRIAAAWSGSAQLPPIPPEGGDVEYMLVPPKGREGGPWFYRKDGTWSYLTGCDRDILRERGVPEYTDIIERYDSVRKTCRLEAA